ncbi:MAG: hypothetical protein A2X49_08680 [Lentisphaerae bacterium GWF2_52_8]|nr:MAG: hypothetical protein A2X49_08680 [Lentisphaerae bacterium GWF2_52_8]
MRKIIFISHATPEDNDFTVWLASRLILLGYNVWYDKALLLGGEKFWQAVDLIIRNEAVKFLFVCSEKVCTSPGMLKDGIEKEFRLAESIAKQNRELRDFIIPLNIGAPYNYFIGIENYNQIPFKDNWAEGLKQLQEKLIKDQIPCNTNSIDSNFSKWYTKEFLLPPSKQIIVGRKEKYYSSWWKIDNLPDFFYIHKFSNKNHADELYKKQHEFPVAKINNYLISFAKILEFKIDYGDSCSVFQPNNIFVIKTVDVLNKTCIGLSNEEAANYLKILLQRIFHLLMRSHGLKWHEIANHSQLYYYTPTALSFDSIKFQYADNKNKRKSLFGKEHAYHWHFAISGYPIFSPFLAFNLKNHITFTDDQYNVLTDKLGNRDTAKLHSLRRKKGKAWFNDEWRDLLFAFLHGMEKRNRMPIQILLAPGFILTMRTFTEEYNTDFGYNDPNENRQNILYDSNIGFMNIDADNSEIDPLVEKT